MKISFKSSAAALSLTLVLSQAGPLFAQSLSDAVGTQSHNFAPLASAQSAKTEHTATTKHHHTKLGKTGSNSDTSKTASFIIRKSHEIASQQQNTADTSAPTVAASTNSAPAKPKTKVPLTPAQIKHHLKMLALRAAHRKAHNALTGFDQVGAKTTDIDSLTRDGSATQTTSTDLGAKDLSIGGAIGRAIAALAIVLGMAYGTLKFMRSRGIGLPKGTTVDSHETDASSFGLHMQNAAPATIDQFQRVIQAAQSKQTLDEPFENGYQKINKSIENLELLGSQELPGTAHTLYKIKIGDRILLLGGSLSGALTALTEWDVETKPETEQQFENVLNQMTMSVTPSSAQAAQVAAAVAAAAAPVTPNLAGGSQADALRTATQRLSRSARRMSEVGRAANDAS